MVNPRGSDQVIERKTRDNRLGIERYEQGGKDNPLSETRKASCYSVYPTKPDQFKHFGEQLPEQHNDQIST